jgi:hypothetical protein
VATYSTNLTTLATADSATGFTELTGTIDGFTLSGAGSPAADGENFIQGVDCVSQTTGKAVDAEISIVYNNNSPLSFTSGHVVVAWCFYAVGVNLKTKANNGWMYVIASSLTAGNYYTFGGSDSGRNPYGGWTNVAIDPTATSTGTLGAGGNGGNYQYFGHVCNTLNEIAKGTPSAVDCIRTGRADLIITGSGGTFAELASYNDWNSTSTPPGTSSTVKDSGYHRFGLFQEAAGTYLWKGLLSLGTTGSTVTFSDANETIIIDDCPFTYAAFNKIEVNNASSSVTFNNITIISTASTANGVGYFEMIDNATVVLTGCSFNNMGNFTFLSNGDLNSCTFNSCGVITQGGADIDGCAFNTCDTLVSTGATASLIGVNSPNTFVGDGTTSPGHAINYGTVTGGTDVNNPFTINWYNELDNGANQATWEGSTQAATTSTLGTSGASAIQIDVPSGNFVKISVAGGATIPTVYKTGTGSIQVSANEVTLTITVVDIITNSPIEGAMVYCTNSGETVTYIDKVETNSSGQVSFTGSLGSAQTLAGSVRAATPDTHAYSKHYKASPIVGTFSNLNDTDITISLIPDE